MRFQYMNYSRKVGLVDLSINTVCPRSWDAMLLYMLYLFFCWWRRFSVKEEEFGSGYAKTELVVWCECLYLIQIDSGESQYCLKMCTVVLIFSLLSEVFIMLHLVVDWNSSAPNEKKSKREKFKPRFLSPPHSWLIARSGCELWNRRFREVTGSYRKVWWDLVFEDIRPSDMHFWRTIHDDSQSQHRSGQFSEPCWVQPFSLKSKFIPKSDIFFVVTGGHFLLFIITFSSR